MINSFLLTSHLYILPLFLTFFHIVMYSFFNLIARHMKSLTYVAAYLLLVDEVDPVGGPEVEADVELEEEEEG